MTADKEKRRAISREAARKRRQVESEVFVDLSRLLPLKPSVRANLDKPSVIRLTLSYIRMHALLKVNAATETSHSVKYGDVLEGGEKWQMCDGGRDDGEKETEEAEALGESHLYLSTLEGFLMVLSIEGDMVYLSDNVSTYMGLTQTELMGHNIFDFTHPADHKEIQDNLQLMSEGLWCGSTEAFVLRIKSTLTHRGRSSNLKSATWKVLNCKGRVMVCSGPSTGSSLLLTCQPLPLSHTLLSTNTFTSQHSMDMRFTYCDQRLMQTLADSPELRKNMPQFLVTLLLGYSPDELLGRSIYDICHTLDTDCLTKNHLNLCLKSQSVSGQYRMLVRGGGYMWVESHSAVIPSGPASKSRLSSHQPLCILCVTYTLSGVEEPSLQLSLDQTIHRSQLKMY